MRKLLSLSLIALITVITVFSATGFTFAQNNKVIDLSKYALENSVNVMLYDESGKIINEFHSDGLKVDFSYDSKSGKIKEIKNNKAIKEVYTENTDGTFDVAVYKDSNFIGNSKKNDNHRKLQDLSVDASLSDTTNIKKAASGQLSVSTNTAATAITPMSLTTYEDYNINGRNMNSLCPSVWSVAMGSDKFGRPSTAMTQTDIQNFFNSKSSVLKDQIQVWAVVNGTVQDTGRRVTPAAVIDTASRTWSINPKVIIATIQKEQSLVTQSYSYSSSHFYACMGYGNYSGTDSGFDTQIDRGTHLFLTLWNAGYNKGQSAFPYLLKYGTFYDPYASLNNNQRITYNGVTYENYIWVKDCGTYALYCYTPWTSTFSGGYDSGNYLFLTCMRSFWPGNPNSPAGSIDNYNGANWN